jgi:tetratricopeptide (TPR) repeat protein
MELQERLGPYLRALLVGLLVALLGLAPLPHAARQASWQAQKYLLLGQPASAAAYLAELAPYYPWRSDLWLAAARQSLQAGDPQTALLDFQRAGIPGRPGEAELVALGDAFQVTGDPAAAEQAWQQAAQLAPGSLAALTRLADLYLAQANYPAAIASLQSLLVLQPGDASLAYRLGLLATALQPDQAPPYLELAATDPALAPIAQGLLNRMATASNSGEPAYSSLAAGRALASLDEWDLAVLAFERATQLRPDYAEAWAFLGEARQHSSTGDAAGASAGLPELEQSLKIDPQSVAANLFTGLYWQRHGDSAQALQYLQTTLQLDPHNPILLVEIGQTIAQTGDLPAAQAYFEQAIAINPNDPTYWRLLAGFTMQYQIQVRELGLPAARRAVTLAPDDPQSLDTLAQTLLYLGDWLNAERFLRRALVADPNYAPAHLHLGLVFYYRREFGHSRQQFDLVEALAPGSWMAAQAQRLLAYYFP